MKPCNNLDVGWGEQKSSQSTLWSRELWIIPQIARNGSFLILKMETRKLDQYWETWLVLVTLTRSSINSFYNSRFFNKLMRCWYYRLGYHIFLWSLFIKCGCSRNLVFVYCFSIYLFLFIICSYTHFLLMSTLREFCINLWFEFYGETFLKFRCSQGLSQKLLCAMATKEGFIKPRKSRSLFPTEVQLFSSFYAELLCFRSTTNVSIRFLGQK